MQPRAIFQSNPYQSQRKAIMMLLQKKLVLTFDSLSKGTPRPSNRAQRHPVKMLSAAAGAATPSQQHPLLNVRPRFG
jgi:hypothetical protein